jgi:hypothetical protein
MSASYLHHSLINLSCLFWEVNLENQIKNLHLTVHRQQENEKAFRTLFLIFILLEYKQSFSILIFVLEYYLSKRNNLLNQTLEFTNS